MEIFMSASTQIYEILHVRLTDFDHLCRDLEQSLVLSGVKDQTLERRLIAVREALEDAATEVREA
jgi:hypothetical protein